MSNVNLKRAVENIRSGTTVPTPLVEVIVDAIQAVEAKKAVSSQVEVTVIRSSQAGLDG